jgi:demethylmenaquinone methyltransferase / 2-methoxy-6-polyprenyl-1,4-benzoquinol methylase
VPLLAKIVSEQKDTAHLWRYYWDTIEACIPPARIVEALRAAGFEQVDRHVELGIFSEYRAVKPG